MYSSLLVFLLTRGERVESTSFLRRNHRFFIIYHRKKKKKQKKLNKTCPFVGNEKNNNSAVGCRIDSLYIVRWHLCKSSTSRAKESDAAAENKVEIVTAFALRVCKTTQLVARL
jgi:Holliday junction resolvase-like predicted endonuclease